MSKFVKICTVTNTFDQNMIQMIFQKIESGEFSPKDNFLIYILENELVSETRNTDYINMIIEKILSKV